MTGLARTNFRSGASSTISGEVSTGASWHEDVEMTEDGAAIADAEDWTWQLNFRSCDDDSSVALSLSTSNGTLTISQGSSSTTLQIRADPDDLADLKGDYVADLASRDGDDRIRHWGHGSMTFYYQPVWA